MTFAVECPTNNTYHTASTYSSRSGLVANTVFVNWSFSNSGLPVSITRRELGWGRCRYQVTVYNTPAGANYFAWVRQNNTGALLQTGQAYVSNPNALVDLGTVRF